MNKTNQVFRVYLEIECQQETTLDDIEFWIKDIWFDDAEVIYWNAAEKRITTKRINHEISRKDTHRKE